MKEKLVSYLDFIGYNNYDKHAQISGQQYLFVDGNVYVFPPNSSLINDIYSIFTLVPAQIKVHTGMRFEYEVKYIFTK